MTRLQRFCNSILDWYRGLQWGGKFIGTALRDWLVDAYIRFVSGVLEAMEQDFTPLVRKVLDRAEATGKVPPEVQPIVDELKAPSKQIAALLGGAMAGTATGGIFSSTIGPFLMLVQYEAQRIARQQRFDPMTALAIMFRRPDKYAKVLEDLRDLGWEDSKIELLMDVAQMRLVEDLLVTLRARKLITPEQYAGRMHLLGYDAAEAEDYFKAKEYYPTPADLVRWQAREVFEPGMIARYGLDAELEDVNRDAFYRAHMTDEQIVNYWRAHWEHASWNQVQEMLFRGEMTEAEVWDWFRLVEIPPYWRQKMINTAYNPFTRVDVRRMHKIGVLTEADLVKAYMDLGYNRERAEKMAEFTVKYNQGTTTAADKDLAKTDILRLYQNHLITEDDATTMLQDLGFEAGEISYLLDLYTKETAVKTRDLTLSQVKNLYQLGLRTKDQVTGFLAAFGYDAKEIAALYDLWDWEKPAALRQPTRAQLDNFLVEGIIDLQTWSDEYGALGYDMKYQEWYYAYMIRTGKLLEE